MPNAAVEGFAGDLATPQAAELLGAKVPAEVLGLVQKKIPLRTEASSVEQMRDMIALAKELDYNLVLDGVQEAWLIPGELKKANVQAISARLWQSGYLPGEHAAAAAYDIARTICRRAERAVVRLEETGASLPSQTIAYLNRLSDLLWLFSRLLELRAGIDSRLRDETHEGPHWSRAW